MTRSLPSIVFLDRDGTIIEDTHYISDPALIRVLPGAAEAVAALNSNQVPVVVVTNQSGIARGLVTEAQYESVRAGLDEKLAKSGAKIDATYFCPHHPDFSECDCRKPGTKLFREAIRDFAAEPSKAAYVGDRWRDVAAAQELGGRGILIPSPATTDEDRRSAREAGIENARNLQEAVGRLLGLTDGGPAK